MDTLAHALYGATFCSRTGLAGGRQGAAATRGSFSREWTVWTALRDWTVWAAAAFGVLPDLTSIGVSSIQMLIRGAPPSFHDIPPYVFVLYHCTHSPVIAGLLVFVAHKLKGPQRMS